MIEQATMLTVCPACGGEGRDIRTGMVYEPGCGHAHRGDVDHGPCTECSSTGVVETEVDPIEMYDLDEMAGEGPLDDGRCPCGFERKDCVPHGADCLYGTRS